MFNARNCQQQKEYIWRQKTRLAFCMQNRSFRLYSNTAVVPQKVFDIVILHEVHYIIDAEWRTNFYLHKSSKDNKKQNWWENEEI